MKRGLRYLPAPPSGRRRVAVIGLGLIAAMSLVWQQQATLATFINTEYSKATFTADTLSAITPSFTTTTATATASWTGPTRSWAAPNYALTGATSSTGANAVQVYSGTALGYSQWIGGTSTSANLTLTDITAGGTHACGIARGQLYCWGNNANGALGLGSGTTSTNVPTLVSGLVGKVVTDVSAGSDHTCAVADGGAYCWGNVAGGRTGTGASANLFSPTSVTATTGLLLGKTVTAISAGGSHSCAVADGAAYCWGTNGSGQLGNTSIISTSVPVAVTTTAGLLSGRFVTVISAGASHSCAVADGLAFCWGLNSNGQLGDATTTTPRNAPVAVSTSGVLNGRAVSAISAGDAHSCAVADAKAYCWGLTTSGRVGNGTTAASNQSSPVAVTGTVATANVTAVSAGSTHSCAIASGAAHCWGADESGQLGNSSTTTPAGGASVAVTASVALSGRALTTISAGARFTCGTGFTAGSCWGLGTNGQLGNKASLSSAAAVDAAVTGPVCATGQVRLNTTDCSLQQGTNYWGRLGYTVGGKWTAPSSQYVLAATQTRGVIAPVARAKTKTSVTVGWPEADELNTSYGEYTLQRSLQPSGGNPVTLYRGGRLTALDRGGFAKRTTSLDVSQISAGSDHSCAVLEGAAYCWGDNTNGELGIGNTTDAAAPTAVSTTGVLSGKTVTAISASMDDGNDGQSTCAIADGGVYCWGANAYGELGNATTTQSSTPVQAGTLSGVSAIATGYMHTCALTGGKVYCWGDDSRGQIGNGATSTTSRTSPVLVQGLLTGKSVTAIAAGAAHTCALADGAVYCWGSNASGQLGINSSGSSTNSFVPVAVLATGVLNGQTVTQVAAGLAHTCAVAGGKVYCWGINGNGQVGNNTTTNSTVAVAVTALPWAAGATLTSLSAGMYSTCVLATGKAYCWGMGGNGQLGNGGSSDQKTPVAVTATGVPSGTFDQISAGANHSCALSSKVAYCWGQNSEGRLGTGNTTSSAVPVAVQALSDPPCPTGASLITPTTCSLAPGTTYYYQLTYTIDGGMSLTSGWVDLLTS